VGPAGLAGRIPLRPVSDDYHPIADYALIGDRHAAALVSRTGSIDWCCLPRFDSGACFARILDAGQGGFCQVSLEEEIDQTPSRAYVDDTLVLRTTFSAGGGQARVTDCFTIPREGEQGERPRHLRELVRTIEGGGGTLHFRLRIVPRFDYGEVDPWVHHLRPGTFVATGGDDALLVWSDADLEMSDRHQLEAVATVRPGERVRLSMTSVDPAEIDAGNVPDIGGGAGVDERVEGTIDWWREWSSRLTLDDEGDGAAARRSAIVLKALTYEPTGAIVAAPTTSLPEGRGARGPRNWDYRYTWIRDSALAVRTMAQLGAEEEAHGFRSFIERSAAGNAKDLQILFGVGGERRLSELDLEHLEGYRGATPVRVGNSAHGQVQLDAYGQLLDQSWRWYERGHEPDDDYWRFLVDLVEAAIDHWRDPDSGIWEWRGEPMHFVHSKALCWTAVDRGLKLAEHCMRKAPERRWRRARDEIRDAIEQRGYDEDRGVFVQAFDSTDMDAALLRLPTVDFIPYDDERMVRTVDAIREDLEADGLLRRYAVDDGNEGEEGVFVACAFWLVECLARQGRAAEARAAYDRAIGTANDLGLMSEEYDTGAGEMLGNFPQALSHLSHLEAVLALAALREGVPSLGTEPGG